MISDELSARQLEQLGTLIDGKLQAERSYARQMVREEVATQIKPLKTTLNEVRASQLEDSNALAGDTSKLSVQVAYHERRITKLERMKK